MTPTEATTLIDYHYWARDRTLDAVGQLAAESFTRDLGNSFGSMRDTLAHIHAAEWVWLRRWQGEPLAAPPGPDQFPDLAAVRAVWTDHERKLRAFFDGMDGDGLRRVIEFQMRDGTTGSAVLAHMLQHVVNHATFHRGQVTTMLRQLGAAAPKSQDLFVFYRERGNPTG